MANDMPEPSGAIAVKCTYPDCQKGFPTEKEMKRHKLNEPEHNYCKKCDVDCEDWEDLTQHKVAAMQPFLEGRMRHNPNESPKHIVCEFCGMDFKSFGGRKKHRQQAHPADQSIECPGCKDIFVRAGMLLAHLEGDHCPQVPMRYFQSKVQHKHVNAQIMQDPFGVQDRLELYRTLALENSSVAGTSDTRDTEEDGGVTLLDEEDEMQKKGYPPLQPEVDMINLHGKGNDSFTNLGNSLQGLSIGSPVPSVAGTEMSASEYASHITSRRAGRKVYTESYPSLSSPLQTASTNEDDDITSIASSVAPSSASRPTAWTTGNTTSALFPDAKPITSAEHWARELKRRENEVLADNSTSLLHCRFWDPSSKDYNPELFFNIAPKHSEPNIVGKYCCPFQGCDDAEYAEAADLEGHLHYAHMKTQFRCPLCLKISKSSSALISHAESNGRCQVRNSTMFHKLLDEVSGGFLKAENLRQARIYKTEAAKANGVMDTKYTAKMPEDR